MDNRRFTDKGWHPILAMVVLSTLFTATAQGQGNTLHVPGDYATIQAAVDAAIPGDLVLVAPGAYPENLDFLGKAIEVRSSGGPDATTIDGGGTGSVVTFNSGEGRDSILDGFTITNGAGASLSSPVGPGVAGGGIYCKGASPTIRGNIVTANSISGGSSKAGGGGIGCVQASHPLIIGNEIHGNTIVDGTKGGGGGIMCYYWSSPVITENAIHDNSVAVGATGIWGGGGINSSGGAATITGNTIYRNTCQFGGGIQVLQSSVATVENNAIFDNDANYGGGIDCYYLASPVHLANNTVYGNRAQDSAGGMRCHNAPSVSMSDTIFWNNTAPTGMEIALRNGSTLDIDYSDVQGGQALVVFDTGSTLNWGADMIDADPFFVDPVNRDFRLQQHPCQPGVVNPCVDGGDPTSEVITGTTRTDLVQDCDRVDMGYHYELPDAPGVPYCFGDPGQGTPCPCGNDNDGTTPGSGCANGVFTSGARLTGSGVPSVGADTLILSCFGLEPDNAGLYFQAENDLSPGLAWGDGLRCAGGGLQRLGVCFSDGTGFSDTSGYPLSISVKAGNVDAGDTKYYQCWYRNPLTSPCGTDFNASNGYAITWQP